MFWPISWILAKIIWSLQLCVVAHAVTSWLGVDPRHPLVRIIRAPAEPILRLVRPLARKLPGPIDWAPAIALLGLELLKRFVG